MSRRILSCILLLGLLFSLTGTARAYPVFLEGEATALVSVLLPDETARARFEATGLPAYVLLEGSGGEILLTGASIGEQQMLLASGLAASVLDPDLRQADYYLAYRMPNQAQADWARYGSLLLQGKNWGLLRAVPAQAERLSSVGYELKKITLTPKPLRPVSNGVDMPTVIDPDPVVQLIIDQVQSAGVNQYDRELAGELPVWVDGDWYTIPSRYTYSGTPIQKATSYVGQKMAGLGLNVEYHQWGGNTYPNVIGEIPGLVTPDDIFIIGAHLDDVQGTPGADDNASGSVATMLAADILSQYQWGCTVRFAFWTGEEQGLNGSAAYAQRASSQGENIVGYLNLDMIAYNTLASSPDIDLIYNPNMPATQDLAVLFADVVDAYNLNLTPQLLTDLGGGSDHSSFWDYGYTSILAIEDQGDFNPDYHGPGDTPSNNDLAYFTQFVKASLGTFVHQSGCLLADGMGYVDGTVSDANNSQPIWGAQVLADDGAGHTFSATTDGSGYYTQTLLTGDYTLTASAFGYLPETITGTQVLTDLVTTQDFVLVPETSHIVDGYITDAVTGWPLYARIDVENGPPVPFWSDPATGYYSISLPENITYNFTVQAFVEGYTESSRSVGPLTGDQTESFALAPDITACSAPGYAFEPVYAEDFEANDGGYTHSGTQDEWEWGTPVSWPNACASGGKCWGTDLDGSYNNNANFSLVSPLIDLSAVPPGTPLHVSWQQAWEIDNGSWDHAYAEVSINGGAYTTMWQHMGNYAQVDWTEISSYISSAAGGNVRFRFRLTSNNYTTFSGYYIDRVRIFSTCNPPTGGLVVGNVYDANTMDGLVGAQVVTDDGVSFSTVGTPDDPTLADGFYNLFAAPGAHILTATYGSFYPVVLGANVPDGGAVSRDFYMGQAGIFATPIIQPVVVPLGQTRSQWVTLLNATGGNVDFTLLDQDNGFLPLGVLEGDKQPLADVPWLNEDPASGSLLPGETQAIELIFDAGVPEVTQPGHYLAEVHVMTTTLQPAIVIPVTMTVALFGVDVTPLSVAQSGDPGTIVEYTLVVTNTSSIPERFAVSLSGGSWPVSAPQWVGPLAVGESAALTVQVTIPQDAAGGGSDALTVTLASEVDSTQSDSALLTTTANHMYGLALAGSQALNGDPGDVAVYTLRLTNTGNTTDTFDLGFEGNIWPVNLPVTQIELGGAQGVDVSVEVSIPAEAAAGASDAVLATAVSQTDGTKSANLLLTTTANYVYRPSMPAALSLGGRPGQKVAYTISLANTGNITDTFLLSSGGNSWITILPVTQIELPVGAQSEFQVQVTIPANAVYGDTDTAVITALSQGDGTSYASTTLLTSAQRYGVVLGGVTNLSGQPGQVVAHTLHLTNTGTTTHTFDMTYSGNLWGVTLPVTQVELPAGESSSVSVQVMIPEQALEGETDYVVVTAVSQADSAATDSFALVTGAEILEADLSVTVQAAPDPVEVGGLLTYTLQVTNHGPEAAEAVVLTDTLPAGAVFVSASQGCVSGAQGVVCSLGTLASGDSATLVLVVQAPQSPGIISNQVSVTSDMDDPQPGNNQASVETTVKEAQQPEGAVLYLPMLMK